MNQVTYLQKSEAIEDIKRKFRQKIDHHEKMLKKLRSDRAKDIEDYTNSHKLIQNVTKKQVEVAGMKLKIWKLHNEGVNASEIARQVGRSRTRVGQILWMFNLRSRNSERFEEHLERLKKIASTLKGGELNGN